MKPRPGRAPALPPQDRRAAIVAATLPLVRQEGRAVTTRQIAEAAGVAEGTIFRVFPDKEALLDEVVATAFDPTPLLCDLAEVDRGLELRPRLVEVVGILQRRLAGLIEFMAALGLNAPPGRSGGAAHAAAHAADDRSGCHPAGRLHPLFDALADLLEPDRHRLTVSPLQAARLLRAVTFAGTHRAVTDDHPLTAEEIVSLLLDGIARHPVRDPVRDPATSPHG